MKSLKKLYAIGVLALLALALPNKSHAQDDGSISYQDFYDNLQPYGTWISDPQYGNVWVPDAEEGFRPYATRGHWVQTEYGTTWVSDYDWGWAPFHYGRWRYDDYYGWEWVPGYDWAPAWVSWRHGDGYYGWAPLTAGISISVSFGGGYHVPDNYWVCAPERYINRPNIYNYYVPHTKVINIIHNTTIINNTYVNNNRTYIAGPRPQEIRQVTHSNVQVYRINNVNRPGVTRVNNQTVNIFRPAVQRDANARPARVVDASAYRQQHPNNSIAAHGAGGAPAYNHNNARQLAMVARTPAPNNKLVHVNPANNARVGAAPIVNRARQAKPNQPAQASAPQQRTQQMQQNLQHEQRQTNQPAQQRRQQQEVTQQQRQQHPPQQAQQQAQQHQQQQAQQHQQQAQQQRQQQAQQQQQQQQQRQQQAQQQQAQQRQQQQAQQRQQQEAQRQQQAQQQQAQQRQQQQAQQQRQQQVQQHQSQQRQQQQAQQRQQQQAQQQQQQRQQQVQQQQSQQRQQQQRLNSSANSNIRNSIPLSKSQKSTTNNYLKRAPLFNCRPLFVCNDSELVKVCFETLII